MAASKVQWPPRGSRTMTTLTQPLCSLSNSLPIICMFQTGKSDERELLYKEQQGWGRAVGGRSIAQLPQLLTVRPVVTQC